MANDITIFQGNNRTIEVTVKDSDGAAYDLTSSVVYFNVKKLETDPASLISKVSTDVTEILINVPATLGTLEVYLLPADTAALLGDYVYDITLVITVGLDVKTYTIEKAKFTVEDPVK